MQSPRVWKHLKSNSARLVTAKGNDKLRVLCLIPGINNGKQAQQMFPKGELQKQGCVGEIIKAAKKKTWRQTIRIMWISLLLSILSHMYSESYMCSNIYYLISSFLPPHSVSQSFLLQTLVIKQHWPTLSLPCFQSQQQCFFLERTIKTPLNDTCPALDNERTKLETG